MKKSFTKRIRVTSTGKLLRRKMGLNHFRAKKSAKQFRRKEGAVTVHDGNQKFIRKYIHT